LEDLHRGRVVFNDHVELKRVWLRGQHQTRWEYGAMKSEGGISVVFAAEERLFVLILPEVFERVVLGAAWDAHPTVVDDVFEAFSAA
jgi:hypothetical protein